ncbi:MAG: hypothetical protein N2511_08625, partial [Thermodesulfovibrionales bacterium]|nr:hypothetical protein [Thermodesulfovibrionales bacterium]
MWTAAKKHLKALEKKGFIKINPSKSRGLEIKDLKTSEIQSIPVLGKIKAGKPTLAIEEIEFYITVDKSLFKSNDLFALRVSGRSMINAGILEDDYVIVRPQATLE